MATLTLVKTWLNLVATGAAVSAYSKPDRTREHGMDQETRTYGGARIRSVTRLGEKGVLSFTLADCIEAQITTLRGWEGQLVQYRDTRGKLFTGVFAGVSIAERPYEPTLNDVAITLKTVTATEGV